MMSLPDQPWSTRLRLRFKAIVAPAEAWQELAASEKRLRALYRQEATEHSRSQHQLRQRCAELEAANQRLRQELDGQRETRAQALQGHEAELLEAKNTAEQASQKKTAFLSSMSHEIRTPMTSVLGFAELLSADQVPAEKRQVYVEKILRNSRHLLALIDNILDLAKIEAGYLVPHCTAFVPARELAHGVDLVRDQAEAKGLQLTLHCSEALPELMLSDQLRFRQIFLNLLSNAVKFTDQGTVVVTAEARAEQGVLAVEVQDTGLGVSADEQGRLFQPFSQVSMRGQRSRPGSGLGLALARSLARTLGGDVTLVASGPQQGSTFLLVLPFAYCLEPQPADG